MKEHLIIDGNAVYEIDSDCIEKLEKRRALDKKTQQQEPKMYDREYKRQEDNRR